MLKNNADRVFYLLRNRDESYSIHSVQTDKCILSKVPPFVALDFLRLNEPLNPSISFLEKEPAYDPDKDWDWWKKNVYDLTEEARESAEKERNEKMWPNNFCEAPWVDRLYDSLEEQEANQGFLGPEDYLDLYTTGVRYSNNDCYDPYDSSLSNSDYCHWDYDYYYDSSLVVTGDDSKQLEFDFPVKGSYSRLHNRNEPSTRYSDIDLTSQSDLYVVTGKTDKPKEKYRPSKEMEDVFKILHIDED